MSEFSESYHLRDAQTAGVALLERAGLAGWVFPDAGGWTAVVPDTGPRFDPDPDMVAGNRGTLVYYFNAEDHGWGFCLWDGATLVSAYQVEWTDELDEERDRLDVPAMHAHLDLAADRRDAIDAALASPTLDSIFVVDQNPGRRFAAALGLSNHEWISGDYLRHGDADADGIVRVEGRSS
jgi:hypothetical protein